MENEKKSTFLDSNVHNLLVGDMAMRENKLSIECLKEQYREKEIKIDTAGLFLIKVKSDFFWVKLGDGGFIIIYKGNSNGCEKEPRFYAIDRFFVKGIENIDPYLVECGFSGLVEYLTRRVFPRYCIEKTLAYSKNKDPYKEITVGLKQLEKKLSKIEIADSEEITISNKDAHALRLFFRLVNDEKKPRYLTDFKQAWFAEEKSIIKIEAMIYIYFLFFPSGIDVKEVIAEIEEIKKNSNMVLEDLTKLVSSGLIGALEDTNKFFSFFIGDDKPLELSESELYYTFKALFSVDISRSSIKNYCEEMNIELKKVGQRNTQDYESFTHPFLDDAARLKFLDLAKNDIKTLYNKA